MPDVRQEYLCGESHLVRRVSFSVLNTEHPSQWDGRFAIPAGASIRGDGGHGASVGKAYHTQAISGDRLQADIFLNAGKITEAQKTAFINGNFSLTPYSYGAQGVASHFEIKFDSVSTNTIQQGGSFMEKISKLFVTEKKEVEAYEPASLIDACQQKHKAEQAAPEAQANQKPKGGPEPYEPPSLIEACKAKLRAERAGR